MRMIHSMIQEIQNLTNYSYDVSRFSCEGLELDSHHMGQQNVPAGSISFSQQRSINFGDTQCFSQRFTEEFHLIYAKLVQTEGENSVRPSK